MTQRKPSSATLQALRAKAERLMRQSKDDGPPDEEQTELMRLSHELEVQYVELELQNEELRRAAKELEASRNDFAELYHSAPVGFVTLDPDGVIEQLNTAAGDMLCSHGRILVGSAFLLLLHPADRDTFHTRLMKATPRETGAPMDLRLKPHENITPCLQVHLSAKFDEENGRHKYRLALVDVTARKHYEQALNSAREMLESRVRERTAELEQRMRQLARLTSELTLAEQRERRRLAELLHDHLQQLLAGTRFNLEMLGQEHGLQEQRAFKELNALLLEAIQTSRSLSAELSPPVLYLQGLSSALEWLARWMNQAHNLQVQVTADPAADPWREDLKVLMFQTVRELLFNVAKHAGTRVAQVEMRLHEGHTRIVVRDQGKGFDVAAFHDDTPATEGGFGLFAIRERLDLLGGRFEIFSRPGQGTTAMIRLPLEAREGTLNPPEAAEAPVPGPERPSVRGDKIRVLLVDDHAMMRKGLSMILAGQQDMEIAGEAADGRQAIELARRTRPDVILMDINMPVMNGLEATQQICTEMPDVCVIGLSMHAVEDQAEAMRAAGAVGYVNKSGNAGDLLKAIRDNACAA